MALYPNAGGFIAGAYDRLGRMGLEYIRNLSGGYGNSERQLYLESRLISSTKQLRSLLRFSNYNTAGTFTGQNRLADDVFNRMLRMLIRTADVRSIPVAPKMLFSGIPYTVSTGGVGPAGPAGANAYVYVGYADDASGLNFDVNPGSHPYIAFRQSNVPLAVVAGIFTGLWAKYFGNNGTNGTNGAPGTTYYLHIGWADDTSGTNYTPTFNPARKYIAFLINTTAADPGVGAFVGLWGKYLGDNGTNGTNGNTVLSGSGVPPGGLGVNGDFYIDIASDPRLMYGPKSGGVWGAGYSLKGNTGDTGATGSNGADGANAFLYVAYADDALGTGFTTAFDPNKDYIAIKNTNVAIISPVVGDFAGLWAKYRGDGDRWTTQSTTSMTIGTGIQTFFVENSLAYSTGQRVVIAVPFDQTKRMEGVCVGYDPLTGQLTVNVDTIYGAGTYASWSVSLQGAPVSIASVNGYFGAIGTQQGSGGTPQATSTSPAKVTQFDTQISQSPGMTADPATDRITMANRGAYVITFSGTVSGTASAEFILQLYKNGVAITQCKADVKLDASGTKQSVVIGGVTIDNISANDYFELFVNATAATPNFLLEQGRLDVHTVGAPNTAQFTNFGPTNVGIAVVTVDQFSAGAGNSAKWEVLIKRGNQVREITVTAIWDGTNPPNYNQSTPVDLAGPIDITMSVTFSGGNINLVATGTSATWVLSGKRTIVA